MFLLQVKNMFFVKLTVETVDIAVKKKGKPKTRMTENPHRRVPSWDSIPGPTGPTCWSDQTQTLLVYLRISF